MSPITHGSSDDHISSALYGQLVGPQPGDQLQPGSWHSIISEAGIFTDNSFFANALTRNSFVDFRKHEKHCDLVKMDELTFKDRDL